MQCRIVIALVLALATAADAEENRGSAGYMLPACKSWLQVASHDLASVKNEIATGNARPGGIVQHFMMAGMCAGFVVGIFEHLRSFSSICPPDGVTNEQLVRMVVTDLERHPEHMHEDFVVPVTARLMVSWPCRAK
jgi:hypothetical protein